MHLTLCRIKSEYCDFLRLNDPKVPHNFDNKEHRPFVGVVLDIDDRIYYAPLTSPKAKHLKMSNSIDFLKIDGGKLGAINLNNMIPVPKCCLTIVDPKLLPINNKSDADYIGLLNDQLDWCNSNRSKILEKAKALYNKLTQSKNKLPLHDRCCDFKACEKSHDQYLSNENKIVLEKSIPPLDHASNTTIKDHIISVYYDEYPPIKLVSESIAEELYNLSGKNDKPLSIKEIKAMHKLLGTAIERGDNTLVDIFNKFDKIVTELKSLQIKDKVSYTSPTSKIPSLEPTQ